MMRAMRENMPLVMWILVIAFLVTIIFSWGMGGFESSGQLDGVVGKIGSREILYDKYNRLVQDRLANKRNEQPGQELTEVQIKQARNDVWNELVQSELMAYYEGKWGLMVTDDEVAYTVRNNPPKFIRDNENFQTEGSFDPAKYEEFLRNPQSADILVAIEQDYRESMGNQKVIDEIIAPAFVSSDEVWDEFVATNRKFKAALVQFPLTKFTVDSGSITQGEIETYYREHRSNYEQPDKRNLKYVTIPVEMTADDTARVYELAKEVKDRLASGESFASIAQELSADPGSAEKGGDLGWFGRGRMVKEFDSTAFVSEPGVVTEPVATRFGLHIIQVTERSKPENPDSVRASHILLNWEVSPDTEERASQKAKDFGDAAKEEGFDAAAARFALTPAETGPMAYSEGGSIPGLGQLRPAMDFAFNADVGAISYVFETKVRGKDTYVIFQLKDIIPAATSPLADVESSIRGSLVQEKKKDLALRAAQEFRAKLQSPDDFYRVALAESLKVDTTGDHALRDNMRVIGTDENIARKLLDLAPGQLSEALVGSRAAYVAVILNHIEPDTSLFATQKKEIYDRLLRARQNRIYSDWLADAKETVGVVDKRYLYYTDF